jgi:hypothetical protein
VRVKQLKIAMAAPLKIGPEPILEALKKSNAKIIDMESLLSHINKERSIYYPSI